MAYSQIVNNITLFTYFYNKYFPRMWNSVTKPLGMALEDGSSALFICQYPQKSSLLITKPDQPSTQAQSAPSTYGKQLALDTLPFHLLLLPTCFKTNMIFGVFLGPINGPRYYKPNLLLRRLCLAHYAPFHGLEENCQNKVTCPFLFLEIYILLVIDFHLSSVQIKLTFVLAFKSQV